MGSELGVDVDCSPLPVQELVLCALAKPRVVLMVPPHLGPGAAHTYLYEGDFSSYSCRMLQISCCFSSDIKVIEGIRHPNFCCAPLIKRAPMKYRLKQKVHLPFLSSHYSPCQPLYFIYLSAVLLC